MIYNSKSRKYKSTSAGSLKRVQGNFAPIGGWTGRSAGAQIRACQNNNTPAADFV